MTRLFKKRSFYFGIFFFSLIVTFVFVVVLDAFFEKKHIRTMHDPMPSSENVVIRGLSDMNLSGGATPRFPDLQRRLSHIKLNKIIVDVKSEKHGYINGIPTDFFGYGVKRPGWRHYLRRLFWTGSIDERPEIVVSEEEEAKRYGYRYTPVCIGCKFTLYNNKIDEIVNLFDTVQPDTWVHVHCTNGRGRTSMILAMFDIMRNAPDISLNDILKRQHLLGSVDLNDTTVWSKGTYNTKQLIARKQFIHDFYDFIVQRKNGGVQLWSTWNTKK